MRFLAVADAEERALGEHFNPARWQGIDAIISCGDLDPEYLDYLVSRMTLPCYYVRGNHDVAYHERPPGGCEDIHGRVIRVGGLRLAGLQGSRWYGGKGIEYSDGQMARRARLLELKILLHGGVDVLVTHAPPFIPEDEGGPPPTDHVHTGFTALRRLVLARRPRLHLHGHTHLGYGRGQREFRLGETRVIDCFRHTIVEIDPL